jgi:hypothetical protein
MCLALLHQSIPFLKMIMKDWKGSCEVETGETLCFEVECAEDAQQQHFHLSYVS